MDDIQEFEFLQKLTIKAKDVDVNELKKCLVILG